MTVFSQGDIIEVNFDPSLGHEPAKHRPALVVSTDEFNRRSSMTFLVPITTTRNTYPLHLAFEDEESGISGSICVEQTRSMDLSVLPCQKIGELGVDEMDEVLNLLGPIFGI